MSARLLSCGLLLLVTGGLTQATTLSPLGQSADLAPPRRLPAAIRAEIRDLEQRLETIVNEMGPETFEPGRVYFAKQIAFLQTKVEKMAEQLTGLSDHQSALERRLDALASRLPPYPTCEVITVSEGRQFRLVGDPACTRGRLQWRIQGHALWHQLCDRTAWTENDAAVACRSLGFDGGHPGVDGPLVGSSAEGHARAIGISCEGWEQHLWQCGLHGETRHDDGCPADTTPVTISCFGG